MQKFLDKRAYVLLLIAIVINAATALTITAITEPPAACSNPYYHHQALGDWDTTVACSNTERNIVAFIYYFVAPFFYLGFITLSIIVYLLVSIFQRKRLSWSLLRVPAVLAAILFFIATLIQIFFLVAA